MEKSLTLLFIGGAIIASVLAPLTAVADFRFEATGSYADADTTFIERNQYDASISWFIAPVNESKGPLAEAAFLSRSSSMRYSYSLSENSFVVQRFGPFPVELPEPMESDLDFELVRRPSRGIVPPPVDSVPVASATSETETKTHSLDTRYVVADTPWIVSSSISVTDGNFSAGNLSSNQDDWSAALGLGRYLLTNTALTLRGQYGESKTTTESTLSLSFPIFNINQIAEFSSEFETETLDIALIGEHVGTVGGFSYQITANAGYLTTDSDVVTTAIVTDAVTGEIAPNVGLDVSRSSLGMSNGWRAGLSGTWYITNRLGLNANYQLTDLENQQTNGYGVGVSWFVARSLEVRGSYARSNIEGASNDLEQWGVTLRGRF